MHDEKRGERYFSMHRLTGAVLTKLINVKLGIEMLGAQYLRPNTKNEAHTKPKRLALSSGNVPLKRR